MCQLDDRGRPMLNLPLPSASDTRKPREEETADERYLRRHQPHVLAEQRYKKWGSHSTRFALDMSLRLERERLKEQQREQRAEGQQAGRRRPSSSAGSDAGLGEERDLVSFWPRGT